MNKLNGHEFNDVQIEHFTDTYIGNKAHQALD